MLEHVPGWLGNLLKGVRAGHAKLVIADPHLDLPAPTLSLTSTAFADGGRIPARFTADGEGASPPIAWGRAPAGTAALALIVEDPDAPTPAPLVHAIVWNLDVAGGALAEGAIAKAGAAEADGGDVGTNSYFREGWLPPDPPTGHGAHDYVFQLFALGERPEIDADPGRAELVAALKGRVIATGLLVGTYSRDEPAEIGPVGGGVLVRGQ